MLELSARTNLLEENAYRYSLQDVEEPNLFREYLYAFSSRRFVLDESSSMISAPFKGRFCV